MITRDRFEKIMDAIASGTAISNARNRFELICSAIATAIGNAGGGGGVTKDVIGEWTIPTDGTYFKNSYTTTKSMADYDYLIVTVETFQSGSGVTLTAFNDHIVEYSEGNRLAIPKPASLGSTSAQLNWVMCTFTDSTTITVNEGPSNSGWITKIVGIKLNSGE